MTRPITWKRLPPSIAVFRDFEASKSWPITTWVGPSPRTSGSSIHSRIFGRQTRPSGSNGSTRYTRWDARGPSWADLRLIPSRVQDVFDPSEHVVQVEPCGAVLRSV